MKSYLSLVLATAKVPKQALPGNSWVGSGGMIRCDRSWGAVHETANNCNRFWPKLSKNSRIETLGLVFIREKLQNS